MKTISRSLLVLVLLIPYLQVFADEDPVFMRVRQVLVESLGAKKDSITLDSSLASLGMTSSNKADVKRNLEVQFGIMISADEFERMAKVNDVVTFFHKKLDQ